MSDLGRAFDAMFSDDAASNDPMARAFEMFERYAPAVDAAETASARLAERTAELRPAGSEPPATMPELYAPRSVRRGRRTRADLEALDETIITILDDEAPLTLRQLYYRLVAAGAIPKTEAAYGTVKRRLLELRESRRVDWSEIIDNTRWVTQATTYDGPQAALRATAALYRRNLMASQPVRIEVWAESDSIGSVLSEVTDAYGIPLYIGRGYSSRGYLHAAAEEIDQAASAGKQTLILQLGDHDPSGEDIARAVRETLERYCTELWWERVVDDTADPLMLPEFERLAVTPKQIEDLDLPYLPVKASDPRTASFAGAGSVEIEAIPRQIVLAILRERIEQEIDRRALEVVRVAEESERAILANIVASMGDAA